MPVRQVKPSLNEKTILSDKGTQPLKSTPAGPIFWQEVHTRRITAWYREFQPQPPEEPDRFFG